MSFPLPQGIMRLCDVHQLSPFIQWINLQTSFPSQRHLIHIIIPLLDEETISRCELWQGEINDRKLKVKTEGKKIQEKCTKKCFSFRSNYFLWFSLRNNLDEHSRIRKKSWQRLSLAFLFFFFLCFFFGGWREKIVKSISPIVPFITTRKHFKGNANWDISEVEMEKRKFHGD